MKVVMSTAFKALFGAVIMAVSGLVYADVISIDGKDYAYTTGFEVDENPDSRDGNRAVIGKFAGHAVYGSEEPKYGLRPVLAYLQEGAEISPDSEGLLLTTTFVLRCVDFQKECVTDELKAMAQMNNVNETYKLRTLEVKNLENWHGVYDYYLRHGDDFAKFYPVLDKGKALRNRDSGAFGGKDAGALFVKPADDGDAAKQ